MCLVNYCTSVPELNCFWYQFTRTASDTSAPELILIPVYLVNYCLSVPEHLLMLLYQATRHQFTKLRSHFNTRTASNKYLRPIALTCSVLKCYNTKWSAPQPDWSDFTSSAREQIQAGAVRMVETIDTFHHCPTGLRSYFSDGKYIWLMSGLLIWHPNHALI